LSAVSEILETEGLTTILETTDFGQWHHSVAGNLGHHTSALLSPVEGFKATMRLGHVAGLQVLHLKGAGALEMIREQCDSVVVWLPLQGISEEEVNGQALLSEPGTAMVFTPGDHLHGRTSLEMEGVSILIPTDALPGWKRSAPPPLLRSGRGEQAVLAAARVVATAAATPGSGSGFASEQLKNSLLQWSLFHSDQAPKERITAVRRRRLINQAREWMETHGSRPFTVVELSEAVGASIRQLQYSFQDELGCSPMAEAKRQRLHRLRGQLLDRSQNHLSIAELMEQSGLLACGVTAADYRSLFGELPRQTRRRSLVA
jgi:AraC family ethanolamine operon transcriptional activator